MAVLLFAMTTAVMDCYQKGPDPIEDPSGTSEVEAPPIPTVNRQEELADAKSKNPDAVAWLYNRERTRLSADNAPPKPFLFTGKLICADCKAPLQGNRETQRRKNGTSKKYVSYFCSRYTASGYGACSRHTIYEMTLTELVLSEIRTHAGALELDEAAALDRLQAQRTAADAERLESIGDWEAAPPRL